MPRFPTARRPVLSLAALESRLTPAGSLVSATVLSLEPTTVVVNSGIALTVTVANTDTTPAATPTGAVSILVDGLQIGTVLLTQSVFGTATGRDVFSMSRTGAVTVRAVYAGDSQVAASASAPIALTVVTTLSPPPPAAPPAPP
ncbi:MAG: Ig-like domain repeat protein, partial [Fimbriiglobus sp.]